MDLDEASKLALRNRIRTVSLKSGIKEASAVFLHLLHHEHSGDCRKTEFCPSWQLARSYFLSGPYEDALYSLLQGMTDVEFIQASANIISDLFIKGPESITFEVLCSGMREKHPYSVNERCMKILVQMIASDKLSTLISGICSKESHHPDCTNDTIVQYLVTLPDHAANRFPDQVPSLLSRSVYNPILYKSMLFGLHTARMRLTSGLSSSIAFVSQLVGKLCLHGFATELWSVLLADIMVSQDFLISRVFHKLILKVPQPALECCMIALLKTVQHYEDMAALLGNSVIDNRKLQHLLVEKLLLHKYFTSSDCHRLLYNIIGYLVTSPSRIHLYVSMLAKLMSVWSDSSSLRHVSFDQHMYMSKALVVSSVFISEATVTTVKAELMKRLMTGLQNHLSASDPSIRYAGMAVAEIMSQKLNPGLEQPLEFTYDSTSELDSLKSMLSPPDKPQANSYRLNDSPVDQSADTSATDTAADAPPADTDDLDSDDDLVPLGKFEDTPQVVKAPPAYIGDCMTGLMETENLDKVEASLTAAPNLIRKNKSMATEVAADFAKIVLHMPGDLPIDHYTTFRHKIFVSLLIVSPQTVATYLCEQFISRNYTVSQRLDVLDSLAAAAMELSDPTHCQEKTTDKLHDLSLDDRTSGQQDYDWRAIVDARIKAKTKRFASATKSAEEGTPNKFSDVAGWFFFPLLRVLNSADGEFNALNSDSMLLVQYLNTLGKIVSCSANSPIVVRISREMFSVIWQFRFSRDPSVRRAVLFCLAMTLFTLHPFQLAAEFQTESMEVRDWLSLLIEKEAEPELQEMAVKIISYLLSSVKQGLETLGKER